MHPAPGKIKINLKFYIVLRFLSAVRHSRNDLLYDTIVQYSENIALKNIYIYILSHWNNKFVPFHALIALSNLKGITWLEKFTRKNSLPSFFSLNKQPLRNESS